MSNNKEAANFKKLVTEVAKTTLVRGENHVKFRKIAHRIAKELAPTTQIEQLLCKKFISLSWRHDRALAVERQLLSMQNSPMPDDNYVDFAVGLTPPKQRRIRNIKKLRFDTNAIESVQRQIIAQEKAMQKALEQYRNEQANLN